MMLTAGAEHRASAAFLIASLQHWRGCQIFLFVAATDMAPILASCTRPRQPRPTEAGFCQTMEETDHGRQSTLVSPPAWFNLG
jgi:hypothetical protein